jgi:hypothetical protein
VYPNAPKQHRGGANRSIFARGAVHLICLHTASQKIIHASAAHPNTRKKQPVNGGSVFQSNGIRRIAQIPPEHFR